VKFIFPNDHGIYLHDTPVRAHFRQAQRIASAGCVRLEDAPALARWLMGAEAAGAAFAADGPPENQVALVQPVPVYLLYLTAAPAGGPLASGRLERRADVYGQDRPKTALASSQP
jgi:murein L,D-transpeptidase YcbB/YkuD